MIKKISPTKQIFLSLLSSIVFAVVCSKLSNDIWSARIKLIASTLGILGQTFLNALQLIGIPLAFFSIVNGINKTKNKRELAQIGALTMMFYVGTTIFATTVGLIIGNILQPGVIFRKLGGLQGFGKAAADDILSSKSFGKEVPSVTSWIPDNLFKVFADNQNLIVIIILAIVIGVAILELPTKAKSGALTFCSTVETIFVRVMGYIMTFAPIGIFGIVSSLFIKLTQENPTIITNILIGISYYMFTVVFGLSIMLFVLYPLMISFFTDVSYSRFLRTMRPAQIFAFSTSSSTATIHKTCEAVGELNVSDKVNRFVISLGATMNMDGTALFQGVAILFITQVFCHPLTWYQQVYCACYLTISSIGVAGIPGGSLITTYVLLSKLNVMGILSNEEISIGLALVCLPDRPLDMIRTAVNITGDSAVAKLVDSCCTDKEKEYRA